jgi:uncharacterized alpha-E superfamily protein
VGDGVMSESLPLLSRVADSVYWLSRYVERAENIARYIGVNLNLQLDLPLAPAQQWQPLIDTTGDTEAFKERYGEARQDTVIEYLAYDEQNPELHHFLSAGRARKRTFCPRDHLPGNVGADQQHVSAHPDA